MNDLIKRTQLDYDKTVLANPESAEQVKEIGKRASKLHTALQGMKGYEEEYYKAFEVMIEAYRVIGLELAQMEKATGAAGVGPIAVQVVDRNPTLAQLGITKNQSAEWQTIALLPRTEIEDYILSKKQERESVYKSAILELANNYKSAQQRHNEEVNKVIATINAFIIQARRVINDRLKYSDIAVTTKTDLFDTIKLCEEILNELNRATM